MITYCPICKKKVALGKEDFPFCSDRCRTIDLGKWASEEYVISSPLQVGDEDQNPDSQTDLHSEP